MQYLRDDKLKIKAKLQRVALSNELTNVSGLEVKVDATEKVVTDLRVGLTNLIRTDIRSIWG